MREPTIVVLESTPERADALVRRIRDLGAYRPVAAKTAEHAVRITEDPRFDVRAVLLAADTPVADLSGAISALRAGAASRRLRFIATGPNPGLEGLARLRHAGVDLSLWEPWDDARLRFQLNRALAAPEQESVRREQRAPTDWRARVVGSGREKEALVYSLSAGGAYLATPRPSMRGARLSVVLPMPSGNLALDGRVLYTNVPGNLLRLELPVGMGIAFEAAPPEVERDLRHAVAQALLGLVV
ncbi:hypothetical protein MYXO_03751 [Myxococcaceae bacterium]|nr:hypothetical protein MYXO_03751 [Myxococcaceae bacterium]